MVAGGFTTCLHFAETRDSYLPLLQAESEALDRSSLMDVGFHLILMNELHLAALPQCLADFGVMSYKMYFAAGGAEVYPGTFTVDDGLLYRGLREAAKLGPDALVMVHCENWEIAEVLTSELRAAGRTDPAVWTDGRPDFCEEDAVRRAIFLAGVTESWLYIVHSSIGKISELIAQARAGGINVIVETCPHYLTIHCDHPLAKEAKYNPAVKAESDLEALWTGLRDGWISTVGVGPHAYHRDRGPGHLGRGGGIAGIGDDSPGAPLRKRQQGAPDDRARRRGLLRECCADLRIEPQERIDHAGRRRGHRPR